MSSSPHDVHFMWMWPNTLHAKLSQVSTRGHQPQLVTCLNRKGRIYTYPMHQVMFVLQWADVNREHCRASVYCLLRHGKQMVVTLVKYVAPKATGGLCMVWYSLLYWQLHYNPAPGDLSVSSIISICHWQVNISRKMYTPPDYCSLPYLPGHVVSLRKHALPSHGRWLYFAFTWPYYVQLSLHYHWHTSEFKCTCKLLYLC